VIISISKFCDWKNGKKIEIFEFLFKNSNSKAIDPLYTLLICKVGFKLENIIRGPTKIDKFKK